MRTRHWFYLLVVAAVMSMLGCGGDDGGPNPVSDVEIVAGSGQLEIGHMTTITATVTGGESKDLDWYVNGIQDGNSTVGTITHNSLATYTAPNQLPTPASVMIKAISVEDSTKADSCYINLRFTRIFVDAANGSDVGNGCINIPVKTITHGLDIAEAGMTVIAMPGIYDEANGEEFAITMPESVALVGMDWETCIIRGHSDMGYEQTIGIYSRDCAFRKFTVEEGEPAGTPWSVAIYVSGAVRPLVDSIRVHERANYSVLRTTNTTDAVIQNCRFVVDDGLREERGYEIINENPGMLVSGCTVKGYYWGLRITGQTDIRIEYCDFIQLGTAVGLIYSESSTPISNPHADLGSDDPGGSAGCNLFTDYTDCGLENQTTHMIYAKYNFWDSDPNQPQAGVDVCNVGTGSIVTQ
jgi:hypothetical protein